MEEELKKLIKQAVKEVIEEMNIEKPKEILTAKELAEYLGVSPAWVSVNKNQIPHFEAGGSKFYRSDIEKWIEENKSNAVLENQIIRKVNVKVAKKLRIS